MLIDMIDSVIQVRWFSPNYRSKIDYLVSISDTSVSRGIGNIRCASWFLLVASAATYYPLGIASHLIQIIQLSHKNDFAETFSIATHSCAISAVLPIVKSLVYVIKMMVS